MMNEEREEGQPHKTWHEKHEEKLTPGQRFSDALAQAVGSWGFIIFQSILVAIWVVLNILAFAEHWDPYPFILLNLLFSTQAAYTAPIIMMSQNRQNERDRMNAAADYETNIAAKREIERLTAKIEKLEKEKIDLILARLPERG